MFSWCMNGEHDKCPGHMTTRYALKCDCPCHSDRAIPKNPCKRCNGTGRHGPVAIEAGMCFRCGGSGKEPNNSSESRPFRAMKGRRDENE